MYVYVYIYICINVTHTHHAPPALLRPSAGLAAGLVVLGASVRDPLRRLSYGFCELPVVEHALPELCQSFIGISPGHRIGAP